MRIVYVIEKLSGIGGMERITIDKMNYLVEHTSHEVVLLLVWHDRTSLAYPLSPKVRIVRLNVPYVPKLISPKLFALYRYNKEIKRLAPDAVVYIWMQAAFLAAFTSWKGKSIYESHLARHAMRHRWVIRRMETRVDVVVTLTHGDAKEFRGAKRVAVIPNMTQFPTDVIPQYENQHCIVLGRLAYQKNIERLISIWGNVSSRHPDWHLDIIGDGPEKDNIKQLIRNTNFSKTVSLLPSTDDVTQYLQESSVYLMTSRFEGLPMVLLEAQTCGLPIVAFDCPYGPREIIEDGKTGFLIPYDDDQMFIEKLSALMDDEELRRRLGKAAKVASQRFQPAPIMAQWIKLFSSLANYP